MLSTNGDIIGSRFVFVSDDYGAIEITNMMDDDNNFTDDPLKATRIVAKLPDGRWLAALVDDGMIEEQPVS